MTPRELYFILAPLGFGVFMALALSTQYRHGWRYPYKWYTAAMLYLAACCITFTPLFDGLLVPRDHPWLYTAHNVLTTLFGPLLMLAFLRLSQCITRVTFRNVIVLLAPFLLYHFCRHLVVGPPFLLGISVAYIAGVTLWWARRICLKVKYQYSRPLADPDEEPIVAGDIGWMRPYSIFIAACILLRWGISALFTPTANDWIRPQLLLIILLYLPALILYEWRHGDRKFFDMLHPDDIPQTSDEQEPEPEEPMQRRDLRAVKVQMRSNAKLPPNAILPHLVSSPSPAPLPADSSLPLDQQLAQLEDEGLFYLDPQLTLGSLAHRLGTSHSGLVAHFQSQGTTFADYLDRLRCDYAAQLIRNHPDATTFRIARQCGFTSHAHFLEAFTLLHNCNPDNYRHAHR